MVPILEVKIFCWPLIFIFMKSPKEVNNQVIINDDTISNEHIIQETPNVDDDYTWDDNKQHTEQHFY